MLQAGWTRPVRASSAPAIPMDTRPRQPVLWPAPTLFPKCADQAQRTAAVDWPACPNFGCGVEVR